MVELPGAKDLREFRRVAPTLSNGEKTLIKSLFGPEIQLMTDEKRHSTHLMESLFGLALDKGLRNRAIFLDVQGEDKKELEPVAMLNRQSFLTEIRKKTGFKEEEKDGSVTYSTDKKFSLFQIDLANLRKADETHDRLANSAGDYNLNVAASSINKLVSEIVSEHGFNISPDDIVIGRYGGDEFTIALIGDVSQEKRTIDMISKLIKERVTANQGYFKDEKDPKTILRKNLRLKGDKVDVITPPKEGEDNSVNKKKIFYSFLKRGLILSNEQLDLELEYITHKSGQNNIDNYLKEALFDKENEYGALNDNERIQYLINRHSELKVPFFLAESLDGKEGNERQINVLRFVENYLSDPLLDEIVISRFDLPNHLRDDAFKTVHSFELKLKEIDDNLSYVYGDQLIMELWRNQLRKILNPYIKSGRVKLGRFAGTIFVGETGEGLPAEVIDQLKTIEQVTLDYKGININHSVGYAETDTKDINDQTREFEVRQKIGEIFNKPTEDWLKKVFTKLFSNPEDFKEFQDIYKNLDPNFKYKGKNPGVLIAAKYFNGKRWEARSAVAFEVFRSMESENKEQIEIVRGLFKDLRPKLIEKYKDE